MDFANGIVRLGDTTLLQSVDSGSSWTTTPFPVIYSSDNFGRLPNRIVNIDFADAQNGLVVAFGAYFDGGLFRTTDGGLTWNRIFATSGSRSCFAPGVFCGRANKIVFAEPAVCRSSNEGRTWDTLGSGAPWIDHSGIYYVNALVARHDTIFVDNYNADYPWIGTLQFTTDFGNTWQERRAQYTFDSYSMAVDSCKNLRIAVANEDPHLPYQKMLVYDYTSDSWTTVSFDSSYLSGSVVVGRRAIYAQTQKHGLIRSLDHGHTWKVIGGPSAPLDTRAITLINDNILLGIDTDGSIWRTMNSGGDSVYVSDEPTSFTFSPSVLFSHDTVVFCDQTLDTSYFYSNNCDELDITSQEIDGPDAQYFNLVEAMPQWTTGKDRIVIKFLPDAEREYHATYKATIGGREVTAQLSGIGRAHSMALSSDKVDFDTLRACDLPVKRSVVLSSESCSPWSVASITSDDSSFTALNAPTILSGSDTIDVAFNSTQSGEHAAVLTIKMDDGTTITEPLSAYVRAVPVSLELPSALHYSTAYLGDDLKVPVNVQGSASAGRFGFALKYDPSVVRLHGITASNGSALAIADNSGEVTISGDASDFTTVASIDLDFRIYTTWDSCISVSMDSVWMDRMGANDCPATISGDRTFELCGPVGCAPEVLSPFLSSGAVPRVSLVPNPASTQLVLISEAPIPNAFVRITDERGQAVLSRAVPLLVGRNILDIHSIPSGSYHLQLEDGAIRRSWNISIKP